MNSRASRRRTIRAMFIPRSHRSSRLSAHRKGLRKAHQAAQSVERYRRPVAQRMLERHRILRQLDRGRRPPFPARKSVIAGNFQQPLMVKRSAGPQVLVQISPMEAQRLVAGLPRQIGKTTDDHLALELASASSPEHGR